MQIPTLLFAFAALTTSLNVLAQPPEVRTYENGVTVQITTPSNGLKPHHRSTITLHYRGTLPDGTEFASSFPLSTPPSFPLSNLGPCWKTALTDLPVGTSATITCPPSTAHGSSAIPLHTPSTPLLFQIHLLSSS